MVEGFSGHLTRFSGSQDVTAGTPTTGASTPSAHCGVQSLAVHGREAALVGGPTAGDAREMSGAEEEEWRPVTRVRELGSFHLG